MEQKIIGITGGIGSGKSVVAKIIELLGVPVFSADLSAHRAYENLEVKRAVIALLGVRAYRPDGRADRAFIAKCVFQSSELLGALNAIVHPVVRADFDHWRTKMSHCSMVAREAAILFESGAYHDCDLTINIEAPLAIRIDRVMRRDGVTKDEVERRVAKQFTDEKRKKLADYTLVNDGVMAVIPQVNELLKRV
jgi:dephospho-CoA kinase